MNISDFDKYVSLDTEMTTTIDSKGERHIEPTQLAITDIQGDILFNEFFFIQFKPLKPMASARKKSMSTYATRTYAAARDEVLDLLRGKIVIGHDLAGDFKALKIDPLKDGIKKVIDSSKLPIFQLLNPAALNPRKLKDLVEEFLNKKIQEGTMHNAREDASATANLIRTTFPYLRAPGPISRKSVAASKIIVDFGEKLGFGSTDVPVGAGTGAGAGAAAAPKPSLLQQLTPKKPKTSSVDFKPSTLETAETSIAIEKAIEEARARVLAAISRADPKPASPISSPNLLHLKSYNNSNNSLHVPKEQYAQKTAKIYMRDMEGLNFRKTAKNYMREMEGLNFRKTAKNYMRDMEGLNFRKTAKNYMRDMEGLNFRNNRTKRMAKLNLLKTRRAKK